MYHAFFGFSEKPFEVTPDPKFLFLTSSHREAFNSMLNGIRDRCGLLSVTGEVGTGKTTLAHFLLGRLDANVKSVFIFNTLLTFDELLRAVFSDLNLEASGKNREALLKGLKEYVYQRLSKEEILVLIIDEAQNLSPDLLKELGDFLNQDPQIMTRLQMIFVGQPEFTQKLQLPGMKGLARRIRISRQIQPLTEDESKAYIEHRLQLVGSSSEKVLTPRAVAMAVHHGQGFPRRINILCDNAFLMGYSSSRPVIDVDILRDVVKDLDGLPKRKPGHGKPPQAVKGSSRKVFPLLPNRKIAVGGIFLLMVLVGCLILFQSFTKSKPERIWSKEAIMQQQASSVQAAPPSPEVQTPSIPPAPPEERKDPGPGDSSRVGLIPELQNPSPEEVVVVEKNQTLTNLALKHYGKTHLTFVDLLMESNPEITNVHLIRIEQKLKVPKISMEHVIRLSRDRIWQIQVGTFGSPLAAGLYRGEPALRGKKVEVSARRVSPLETWYRVSAGPYGTREEALKAAGLLKDKGLLPIFPGGPENLLSPGKS